MVQNSPTPCGNSLQRAQSLCRRHFADSDEAFAASLDPYRRIGVQEDVFGPLFRQQAKNGFP